MLGWYSGVTNGNVLTIICLQSFGCKLFRQLPFCCLLSLFFFLWLIIKIFSIKNLILVGWKLFVSKWRQYILLSSLRPGSGRRKKAHTSPAPFALCQPPALFHHGKVGSHLLPSCYKSLNHSSFTQKYLHLKG